MRDEGGAELGTTRGRVTPAEAAWTRSEEEEKEKQQSGRQRAATHRTSRLVVPLRSGNSLMSVAPLSDLQRRGGQ